MLGVIGRLAELGPGDVVLEVGPGSACSRRSSPIACGTCTPSSSTVAGGAAPRRTRRAANVDLDFGDALAVDLGALEPAPTKLVANLPYNVATPLVAESLDGLPTLGTGA